MVNLWDSANVARQGERFDTTAAREWGYVIIQRHDWRLEGKISSQAHEHKCYSSTCLVETTLGHMAQR
ncbi:hypothetical protein N7468_007680 [Penicillium chermesinum]|uniref:Uncharacterized protein n=1 Tax=Penicillium chermesinum TaxID=63820 RepID=A0A9W9NUJ9_9EURO|nr:uncharacterized protein N7468_007680 [Penicillium chermesinum]KAJ5226455.1 hypothetical protein N7468_007680 [Penicillium chermesinum]